MKIKLQVNLVNYKKIIFIYVLIVMKCVSCHINLVSEDKFTRFPCPSCMEEEIVRCIKCRRRNSEYACTKCGFKGP